jgi:hypothetical protein
VSNLAGLLAGKSEVELENIALAEAQPVFSFDQTSARLKKLGRKEGRALKSRQIRYALTPDVHVYLNQKILPALTIDDVDALANAFKNALLEELTS